MICGVLMYVVATETFLVHLHCTIIIYVIDSSSKLTNESFSTARK